MNHTNIKYLHEIYIKSKNGVFRNGLFHFVYVTLYIL